MTQFRNDILANNILVRDAIKSENFQSGVSGWSIERDGTAEFYDIVARGSVTAVELDIDNRNHPTGDRGRLHVFQDVPNLDQRIDWTIGQDNINDQLGGPSIPIEKHPTEILHDIDTANEAPRVRITSGSFDQFRNDYLGELEVIGRSADRNIGFSPFRLPRVLFGSSTWIESQRMRPHYDKNVGDETPGNTSYQVEANPAQIVFTAPPSGVVTIELVAFIDLETDAVGNIVRDMYVSYEVRQGNVLGSGTIVLAAADDRAAHIRVRGAGAGSIGTGGSVGDRFQLAGLTPGDDYNIETHNRIDSTSGVLVGAVRDRSLNVRLEM